MPFGMINYRIGEGASVRAVTCLAVWCGITNPADRDWVEKVLSKQK
jgi:hypothetical protein